MNNTVTDFENISEEQKEQILKEAMDEKKQKSFYEKLRKKVEKHIEEHPNSKYINYLIAAPDFFYMMCKLLGDNRVPIKNKLTLAAAIAYFVSPLDFITDVIPGIGVVDDVIIVVGILNSLVNSVSEDVLKEHWPGDGDVMEQIKQLLELADTVVGSKALKAIKGFIIGK